MHQLFDDENIYVSKEGNPATKMIGVIMTVIRKMKNYNQYDGYSH